MVVARNPPWANLPQELLYAIANTSSSDPLFLLVFRSVCTSWRSSCNRLIQDCNSPPSPTLPLFIPSPCLFDPSTLSLTVVYALRPSIESAHSGSTWVLFLDEFQGGKLSLRKPFSGLAYELPVSFPKAVSLLEFSACELGRFYSVTYPGKGEVCSRVGCWGVVKVLLCSDEDGLSYAVGLCDDSKLAVCKLDAGVSEVEVAVGKCRDSLWNIMPRVSGCYEKGIHFDDIVLYKGRVLGVERKGGLYEINYHSFEKKCLVFPFDVGYGRRKRLVESLGLLYLVVMCHTGKVIEVNEETRRSIFKVYELDEGKKEWVDIGSLGDRSFFFGLEFSFSASAQDLGTYAKNCILFEQKSFQYFCGHGDDNVTFSKLKSSSLGIGVCNLNDNVQFGGIDSYPGYFDLLWPPPPWIWSIDRLRRLGTLETIVDEMLNRIPEKCKIKAAEQTVDGSENSHVLVLKAVEDVVVLKNSVTRFQQCEQNLDKIDNRLVEARPNNGTRDTPGVISPVMRKHYTVLFQLEELATKFNSRKQDWLLND